jgi:hypothetical protein
MQPKFKGGYHCIVDDYTMIHIINYMRFMSFQFSFSHINRYKFCVVNLYLANKISIKKPIKLELIK